MFKNPILRGMVLGVILVIGSAIISIVIGFIMEHFKP